MLPQVIIINRNHVKLNEAVKIFESVHFWINFAFFFFFFYLITRIRHPTVRSRVYCSANIMKVKRVISMLTQSFFFFFRHRLSNNRRRWFVVLNSNEGKRIRTKYNLKIPIVSNVYKNEWFFFFSTLECLPRSPSVFYAF